MKHLAPFQCLCFTQDTKIQSKKHSVLYCRSVYYNASIICAWWIKKNSQLPKIANIIQHTDVCYIHTMFVFQL